MGIDWNIEARRRLKVELARKEITHRDLVARLGAIGVAESEENVRSKVRRGGFSFSFFLQCMTAIDTENVSVRVDLPEQTGRPSERLGTGATRPTRALPGCKGTTEDEFR